MSSDDEESTAEIPERLPFSVARQDAVLGHLFSNDAFFLQCVDKIDPGWFNNVTNQKLWQGKRSFFKEHKRIPTKEEVLETRLKAESQNMRGMCTVKVAEFPMAQANHALDIIQTELTEWLHSRIYMAGTYAAQGYYNKGQFKQAYSEIEKAVRQIRETSFNNEVVYDFSNPASIIEKRMSNVAGAMTFGHPLIDKLLLPEGNGNGSLLPGCSTTLVAPINVGKTAVMMGIAIANVKRQKRVLYVAHEGNVDELRLKFLQIILNRSNGWLIEHVKNPSLEDQNRIDQAVKYLNEYLHFLPLIRAGQSVEDVVSAIRQKTEHLKCVRGENYHMVIDDYPAKLTTEEARGGKMEKRNKDQVIYSTLNTLAEENGWHNLNAIQTNRTGSKINKGFKGFDERLLGMEDVNESWGPMADTATVFTLNRPPGADQFNFTIINNVKSRTSQSNWAVVCRSKFENYISHSRSLQACWYKGDAVSTAENYNIWLDKYCGLPDGNGDYLEGKCIDWGEKF